MIASVREDPDRPGAVAAAVLVEDRFLEEVQLGAMAGTRATSGAPRIVTDVEGRVGADGGAARFRPMSRPGWGRQAVSYGPFEPRPGLVMSAEVLNGHNSSQTFYLPESVRQRLRRWLTSGLRFEFRRPRIHDNLAVGWAREPAPTDVGRDMSGFLMHAATERNGELRTVPGDVGRRLLPFVPNVPIRYVASVRDGTVALYASTITGVPGLQGPDVLTPLAIIPSPAGPTYACVQQCILGEVGYQVDTRVRDVRVVEVPGWTRWYGTARAADRLVGHGRLEGSVPALGVPWRVRGGALRRTPEGALSEAGPAWATVRLTDGPPGLMRVLVRPSRSSWGGLVWYSSGSDRAWGVAISRSRCRLLRFENGVWRTWLDEPLVKAARQSDHQHDLQILSAGSAIAMYVDGDLAFDRWFELGDLDMDGARMDGVGIFVDGYATIEGFECHPRQVPIPDELGRTSTLVDPPRTRGVTIAEDLHGRSGPLDDALLRGGLGRWQICEGQGAFTFDDSGLRVVASRERPNPGRTLYTVPWGDQTFADVACGMTPPGTARHQGHRGRGGLVLWSDADNYVVVNIWLDDTFDGTSVSSFYRLAGTEDMYEAVWTNVDRRVTWGRPFVLRAAFDGRLLTAFVDDVPVLQRALSDVRPGVKSIPIKRVGLAANWEWGDDTGTIFHSFIAHSSKEHS